MRCQGPSSCAPSQPPVLSCGQRPHAAVPWKMLIPCSFLFASSNPNWGSDSRTLRGGGEEEIRWAPSEASPARLYATPATWLQATGLLSDATEAAARFSGRASSPKVTGPGPGPSVAGSTGGAYRIPWEDPLQHPERGMWPAVKGVVGMQPVLVTSVCRQPTGAQEGQGGPTRLPNCGALGLPRGTGIWLQPWVGGGDQPACEAHMLK